MTNMMQDAFGRLKDSLLDYASNMITIERGGETVFVGKAVVAKSRFYDVDYTQQRVTTFSSDFIIDASAGYEPQSGDLVNYDGVFYVVRPAANELWAYDDPYRTTIRIHTQLRG